MIHKPQVSWLSISLAGAAAGAALFPPLTYANPASRGAPGLNEVPPAERVVSDMRGFSERDSASRASAALLILNHFASKSGPQLARAYTEKEQSIVQRERAKYGEADDGFARCHDLYYQSPEFWRKVLDRYFTPDYITKHALAGTIWKQMLAIPPGTVLPLPNAAAVPTVCGDDPGGLAARRGVADQRKTAVSKNSGEVRAGSPAEPDPSIAKDIAGSKAAQVDTTVFGIALGKPLVVDDCPGGLGIGVLRRCKLDTMNGDLAVFFPTDSLPNWAIGPENNGVPSLLPTLKGGVVVAMRVHAEGTENLRRDLERKYRAKPRVRSLRFSNAFGKTWEAKELEWFLSGLHVKFELDSHQGHQGPGKGVLLIEYDSLYKARKSQLDEEETGRVKL